MGSRIALLLLALILHNSSAEASSTSHAKDGDVLFLESAESTKKPQDG